MNKQHILGFVSCLGPAVLVPVSPWPGTLPAAAPAELGSLRFHRPSSPAIPWLWHVSRQRPCFGFPCDTSALGWVVEGGIGPLPRFGAPTRGASL
jgi:hypothetical protein